MLEEMSITSHMHMTAPYAESKEKLKRLLKKVTEESEKASLNSIFKKLRSCI